MSHGLLSVRQSVCVCMVELLNYVHVTVCMPYVCCVIDSDYTKSNV